MISDTLKVAFEDWYDDKAFWDSNHEAYMYKRPRNYTPTIWSEKAKLIFPYPFFLTVAAEHYKEKGSLETIKIRNIDNAYMICCDDECGVFMKSTEYGDVIFIELKGFVEKRVRDYLNNY